MEKKKILIVDDETITLRLLEKKLSDAGYLVLKADNGKDAIILAKKEHPNLIMLDIVMPGIDGGETGHILKNDPQTKDIPILFLTCLVKKDEVKDGNLKGGNYFIAKPYNPDELLNEVGKHL